MELNLQAQKYDSKNAYNPDTDSFCDAKYGLFFHVLPDERSFRNFVEGFDADVFAQECAECGAGYVFFTLCQNSGFLNVPSRVYSEYSAKPDLCSPRDSVAELYEALSKYGIRLMLYVPANAPQGSEAVAYGFGCREKDSGYTGDWLITDKFTERWCQFYTELSCRYKERISGWWIDGFYEWSGCCNDTAQKYAKALKSGNKKAIIAFNGGANSYFYPSEYDDYLAGEWNQLNHPVCENRWINGVQWHELSYIGSVWGGGTLQYTADEISSHIHRIGANGGVISIDLPMEENYTRIRKDALQLMKEVRKAVRK